MCPYKSWLDWTHSGRKCQRQWSGCLWVLKIFAHRNAKQSLFGKPIRHWSAPALVKRTARAVSPKKKQEKMPQISDIGIITGILLFFTTPCFEALTHLMSDTVHQPSTNPHFSYKTHKARKGYTLVDFIKLSLNFHFAFLLFIWCFLCLSPCVTRTPHRTYPCDLRS